MFHSIDTLTFIIESVLSAVIFFNIHQQMMVMFVTLDYSYRIWSAIEIETFTQGWFCILAMISRVTNNKNDADSNEKQQINKSQHVLYLVFDHLCVSMKIFDLNELKRTHLQMIYDLYCPLCALERLLQI